MSLSLGTIGGVYKAIAQLERLLDIPAFFSASSLAIDPTWEPLRENPRFRTLIGSV